MNNKELDIRDSVTYDMIVNKNRTLEVEFVAEVCSGNTVAGRFEFSGYTGAILEVKVRPQDDFIILKLDSTDNEIQLFSDGLFTFNKSAQGMNVRAGEYVYDMYLIEGTIKRAFLTGKFIIIEDVTQ